MKRILFVFLLSCSAGSAPSTAASPAPPTIVDALATPVAGVEDAVAPPTDVGEVDTVPTGTFADPGALCEAQMKRVTPHLAAAERSLRDMGGDERLAASCIEDGKALRHAHLSLRAPFLEGRAITYETGYATNTSLVVRTSEGWMAVREPLSSDFHNDPGCGCILRDRDVVDIHSDGSALVIVTMADRGHEGGTLNLWRARTCKRENDTLACSLPQTIKATLVPDASDAPHAARAKEKVLFETGYTVDREGALVPDRTWGEENQE